MSVPVTAFSPCSDFYLTSVAWVNEKSLIAVWLTRVQNYSSYSLCSPLGNGNDWQCTDVGLRERNRGREG